MDKLQKYEKALKLIAKIGCMQSAEDEEFFCKKDGSGHSIYCPAGIALKALQPTDSGDKKPCKFKKECRFNFDNCNCKYYIACA